MKVRRDFETDDDSHPVMVPRNDKALVAIAPERIRRLREHLIKALRELRTAKHLERSASPLRPEPAGFAARVALIACSLCKGWCCRNGDDDAFLDDQTLARVRVARPDLSEPAVLRLFWSAYRRSPTKIHASFTENEVARWTVHCAPMSATAISAAISALT